MMRPTIKKRDRKDAAAEIRKGRKKSSNRSHSDNFSMDKHAYTSKRGLIIQLRNQKHDQIRRRGTTREHEDKAS